MANTNAQMKKIHKVAMDCIKHLVIVKKFTPNQAEEMVLTTLKESEHYLKNEMIDETIASLKMIHMDQSPEQAAREMIKSILR